MDFFIKADTSKFEIFLPQFYVWKYIFDSITKFGKIRLFVSK